MGGMIAPGLNIRGFSSWSTGTVAVSLSAWRQVLTFDQRA